MYSQSILDRFVTEDLTDRSNYNNIIQRGIKFNISPWDVFKGLLVDLQVIQDPTIPDVVDDPAPALTTPSRARSTKRRLLCYQRVHR